MSGSFFDTNVLVYADDGDAPAKQARAVELVKLALRDRTGYVSMQVLCEYFSAVTRKLQVPAEVARRKVELLAGMHVVVVDTGAILGAIDLHRLHRISFWDALILQMAISAGCHEVLSENLAAGARLRGVKIVNPFA